MNNNENAHTETSAADDESSSAASKKMPMKEAITSYFRLTREIKEITSAILKEKRAEQKDLKVAIHEWMTSEDKVLISNKHGEKIERVLKTRKDPVNRETLQKHASDFFKSEEIGAQFADYIFGESRPSYEVELLQYKKAPKQKKAASSASKKPKGTSVVI